MYNLLNRDFVSQYTEVARLIAEAVNPERIYLLGCSITNDRTESIFYINAPTRRFVSNYYVLVLVNKNRSSCNDLQDKIENHCRAFIPVTAIILDGKQYTDWLTEGHAFASKVHTISECIYETGNTTLPVPAATDERQLAKTNEARYTQGLNKVEEFLAGADLYRIRKQNKMAAFMLHQAAEHALHTLLKITTGLHVVTHNIDKLIRYCTMVSYQLPAVFPRNNDKNERLFQLLQKAYIDARYKDDYKVGTEDLLTVTERVRQIEELLKDVGRAITNPDHY